MTSPFRAPRAVLVWLLLAVSVSAQQHEHGSTAAEKLGTVHFATSCSAAAQPQFNRAVALLHSFEFAHARSRASPRRSKTDPSCAMAEWGIALSRWSNPFAVGLRPPAALQQGRDAVERGREDRPEDAARGGLRRRPCRSCIARLRDRRISGRAWSRIATRWPSLVAGQPGRHRGGDLLRAGDRRGGAAHRQDVRGPSARRARFSRRSSPPSRIIPGLSHYIIHSYDVPPLAPTGAGRGAPLREDRAVGAARAAHAVAHVHAGRLLAGIDRHQHRLGRRPRGATARPPKNCTRWTTGRTPTCRPAQDRGGAHAGRRPAGGERRGSTPTAIGSAAPGSAGVFALAAIPARYALERGAWAEAAKLVPQPSRFPYADALTYFARALGAARTGDARRPRASAIEALQHDRRAARRSKRNSTGRSRSRFSGARRRPGSRWSRGARPRRSRRCRRPRRWKMAPRNRP